MLFRSYVTLGIQIIEHTVRMLIEISKKSLMTFPTRQLRHITLRLRTECNGRPHEVKSGSPASSWLPENYCRAKMEVCSQGQRLKSIVANARNQNCWTKTVGRFFCVQALFFFEYRHLYSVLLLVRMLDCRNVLCLILWQSTDVHC